MDSSPVSPQVSAQPLRTVVFINAHARRGRRSLSAIQKFFITHTIFQIVDYIVVEDLQDFPAAIARLKSHKNISYIIVGGGDGTIMTVINALKKRKGLTYGFLPLGTTNVFARNLGLPHGFKKSLQVIADRYTNWVNLGSVNGVYFVNFADIGITAHVAKKLKNRSKRYLGPLAYYLFGLKTLPSYEPFECQLQIGKETLSLYTYNLSIIKGSHYGPITAVRTSSTYNDNLTIVYSTDSSRVGFVRDANSFFTGRQYKRRNIFMVTAQQLTINTPHPQDIQADGEIVGKTPADVRVIKHAIQVLVPEKRH